MNILYDHQMFALQKYGGITRIFVELMRELTRDPANRVHWFRGVHLDQYDISDFSSRLASYWAGEAPPGATAATLQESNTRAFKEFVQRLPAPCDLYHPSYYDGTPLRPVPGRRLVVTVYDMILEKYLSGTERFRPTIEAKRRVVEQADLIFAISRSTARDLVDMLRIDESRIRVTPLAGSMQACVADPFPPSLEGPPFFLYVGPRSKYKNFDLLLRAFATDDRLRRGYRVVCAGGPGPFAGPELEALTSHRLLDRFVHVNAGDGLLKTLYQRAIGLVYTSRYEGFGLPPLEAMQCDCPVLCCPTSSLPEVVGDAALTFDPDSPEELAGRLLELAGSAEVRERCVTRGRARAALFSWERTAQATLAGYRAACGIPEPRVA